MSEMQSTTDNTLLDEQSQKLANEQVCHKLAKELGVKTSQVVGFVDLYDNGATVPFIARYRKEQTGGLDDSQLRSLEKSLNYERDMLIRREKIILSLKAQDKLTDELKARIDGATSKLQLEDIYLPYRPRRRSLSSKAKMAGLEPIALSILQTEIVPAQALADYHPPETITDDTGTEVDFDFSDFDKQLAGVQAIIIDLWLQDLALLDNIRTGFLKTATLICKVANEEKREVGEKFKDYFEHSEALAGLPNHRLLAMLRGRKENILSLKVDGENQPFIDKIVKNFELTGLQPSERQDFLGKCANSLWSDKWRPNIEHRLLTEKRLLAEADSIDVFANNLQHLLMSAPAGRKVILGVDPGIRHGLKMVVIGAEGQVLQDSETGQPVIATVYPFDSEKKLSVAKSTISQLIRDYNVELVAIGNGTASRQTDALLKEIITQDNLSATAVVVNESGASVYSASELASDELPQLDVSIRGAVSIARRLQDPLSELVKVDPKAIGVGQYQHDVNQAQLADSLDKVTQDCVNAVGVDVNTASTAILSHISGLNRNVAQQIVAYRKDNGAFSDREQLKAVPRLGAKTFEQSAGFLRIRDGQDPLDATGVHPESYDLVHKLLTTASKSLTEVLGNDGALQSLLQSVNLEEHSQLAVKSVINELAKPAHDPRPAFITPNFREDVNSLEDLEEGMILEGVVTNVTSFGCFVDVGVHQDGLVHISEMTNEFVENPLNLVTPGDIIKVKVVSLDTERKRIGFSMKKDDKKPANPVPSERPDRKTNPVKVKSQTHNKTSNKRPTNAKPSNHKKPKPNSEKPVGSLGALLKQAGL